MILPACASGIDLGVFQTGQPEYGLVRGPDGYYLSRQDGAWGQASQSRIAAYSQMDASPSAPRWAQADADESDFYYSFDRKIGCFISDRLGNGADIWCVEWADKGWNEPYILPDPVNSPASEYSPVIRPNGDIYFASDREGGAGLGDIYVARQREEDWSVRRLGDAVNSAGGEWNLEISPDGKLMIFEASHRETNITVSGDLYVSRRTDSGWSPAVPLSILNTKGSDLMPRFLDAETLVYARSVGGDVNLHEVKLRDLNIP